MGKLSRFRVAYVYVNAIIITQSHLWRHEHSAQMKEKDPNSQVRDLNEK